MIRFICIAFVGAWSTVAGAAPAAPATRAATRAATRPSVRPVTWQPLPIRTEKQVAAGMRGGEGGQCLHGIARALSDDRRIYLAVDVVGVWRSRDGGASWEPCRMNGFHCIGTSSVAVSPRDPERILAYADAAWEKDRVENEGLYQSADGGQTWVRVVECTNEDARRGYRRHVDFTPDGRRAYFASHKSGFYRSDDAGVSFTRLEGFDDKIPWEVEADPRNRDTVYVAAEEGLFISKDAGKSFTRLDALDGNISSITADPATKDRLWAVSLGQGLFRSDDAGQSFIKVEGDGQARHLFQSPIDPRRIILAGESAMKVTHDAGQSWKTPRVDFSRAVTEHGGWGYHNGFTWSSKQLNHVVGAVSCEMYASADGGLTFRDSMAGYTGFHHGWSDGAVSFAADDPKRFAFFNYDYALALTTDGGRSFRTGRLKEQVQGWWGMYAGDMHPNWKQTPTIVAAAGNYWRNELVRTDDAGRSWRRIDDTEGAYFFVRFHPKDPGIVYADDRRSDDGGKTFRKLHRHVYAYAPSRPDTVYSYSENILFRSDDRGDTWKPLPPPPRPAGPYLGRRDIEVDPKDENKVLVMTPPDAALFDGKEWRTIPASRWVSPKPKPYVSRMAIDPDRPTRILLGLDSMGTSYLFLSDDSGQTWNDITGNLPRLGANQSLNIQPGTGRIFVGAGFGTWTAEVPRR